MGGKKLYIPVKRDFKGLNGKTLIAEGNDEAYFACACLAKKLEIQIDQIVDAGGYKYLPGKLDDIVKGLENGAVLGVFCDADYYYKNEGTGDVWTDFKTAINKAYKDTILKTELYPEQGFSVTIEDGLLTYKVGIFISGYFKNPLAALDELILEMIPRDLLFEKASATISEIQKLKLIPEFSRRIFNPDKQKKAFLKTWLAWQKEPGMAYGKALSENLLNETPEFLTFKSWLQRLYSNEND